MVATPLSIHDSAMLATAQSLATASAPPPFVDPYPLIQPLEPSLLKWDKDAVCFQFWIPARYRNQNNLTYEVKITIDDREFSVNDGEFSSLLLMIINDDYDIGGPTNGCLEPRLKSGLHLITVEITTNSEWKYSYSWALHVE